eukprot:CAMPEP_0203911202 /NCGR_PEP_ID=MMETSP0359-20131031/52382_1 /ASSEMBLY_ACC=CAM_ASM_000338 /TAXON_ID=268821 /ORGANISM="Scrippsiella Hangoei, Strain SHTV-5" /LENGTH=305 /DNA_ID=CAMNT_0050836849 /DNA_START=283 /DNA_END=1200 /DNA_ORIENTATION=-
MSTVGYGDLSPASVGTRIFTMFMILFGIVVIFPGIVSVIGTVTDPITSRGRRMLEWLFPQLEVDLDGDGETDYKIPGHPVVYYSKNLLPSLLLLTSLQLASAGLFMTLEDWSYFEAYYQCIVTSTTVGYGDLVIATQGGRLWASMYMILSVCMLGEIISTLGNLHGQRAEQLERIQQLSRRLDHGLLDQMLSCAKELRPEIERDEPGLDELEFALTMLIELGIVKMDQVRPFIKQFRMLDVTNDGRIDIHDIRLMHSLSPEDLANIRLVNRRHASFNVADRCSSRPTPSRPAYARSRSTSQATAG